MLQSKLNKPKQYVIVAPKKIVVLQLQWPTQVSMGYGVALPRTSDVLYADGLSVSKNIDIQTQRNVKYFIEVAYTICITKRVRFERSCER
jgi:hypothetical protein